MSCYFSPRLCARVRACEDALQLHPHDVDDFFIARAFVEAAGSGVGFKDVELEVFKVFLSRPFFAGGEHRASYSPAAQLFVDAYVHQERVAPRRDARELRRLPRRDARELRRLAAFEQGEGEQPAVLLGY